MLTRVIIALMLCFHFFELIAQSNTYFVSFTDKQSTPFSVDNPGEFLSSRAIQRRTKQLISIQEKDLPVDPAYISGISAINNVSVRFISKWMNGLIIQTIPSIAESIKILSYVAEVEYLAPGNAGGRRKDIPSKFELESNPASDSLTQFDLLGIGEMREAGFEGEGMLVAVMDGGFLGINTVNAFAGIRDNQQIMMSYDFISRTTNIDQYSGHGTRVLSLMAAAQTSPDFTGIIPDANYLLFITENVDIEYRIEEYWFLIAAERADSAGVDVITSSLGYNIFQDPSMDYQQEDLDGRTALISLAAQTAADCGILFVTSGGNTGDTDPWRLVTFPADIVDGLAVGSLINENVVSNFSPYGPSNDNRIKPDVVAIGSGVTLISDDGSIVTRSGTSFSAPQVAGLATGVWQANPDITSKELLRAIRESSSNSAEPDNRLGYGIPSYPGISNYLDHVASTDWVDLYPNPVINNSLYVDVVNPQADNSLDIKLFNSLGQPILLANEMVTWRENGIIIDISALPRGIYILNLRSLNNYSQRKISKL